MTSCTRPASTKFDTMTAAPFNSKFSWLQDIFDKVFQIWITEYSTCGCQSTVVSPSPFPQWHITLSLYSGCTMESALDTLFMAEDSDSATRVCSGSCGQRHSLTARRICRLPLTCILELSRVHQDVSHCHPYADILQCLYTMIAYFRQSNAHIHVYLPTL